jgi:hypothetical protein
MNKQTVLNKITHTKKNPFDEYKEINCVLSNIFDVYKRRPRRPPFRRVLSDGIGVTSSTIKKLFILFSNKN